MHFEAGMAELGGLGGPIFGRSVNSISTRGGRLCPTIINCPSKFSDLPPSLQRIEVERFSRSFSNFTKQAACLLQQICSFADCVHLDQPTATELQGRRNETGGGGVEIPLQILAELEAKLVPSKGFVLILVKTRNQFNLRSP